MNELNAKVLELQKVTINSPAGDFLFSDIYMMTMNATNDLVAMFRKSLHGDEANGHSKASDVLIRCIETFEYKGYDFLTYYKKSLHNALIDECRLYKTKKMQPNINTSQIVAMDNHSETPRTGLSNSTTLLSELPTVTDELPSFEELSFEGVLFLYKKEHTFEYRVIETLIEYSAEHYKKSDLTTALASLYESDKYTSAIQKRVSRIRNHFKEFALDLGYSRF